MLVTWSSPSPCPNTDLILDVSTLYMLPHLDDGPYLTSPPEILGQHHDTLSTPSLTRDESRALETPVVCIYKSSSV